MSYSLLSIAGATRDVEKLSKHEPTYFLPNIMFSRSCACSFADRHRALSFIYVTRAGDEMAHFKHAGSDALELHNNATIKRASTTPTTDALINLPASEGGVCAHARDGRC